MTLAMTRPAVFDRLPVTHEPLLAETNFYSVYGWCLDPDPTVQTSCDDGVDRRKRTNWSGVLWQQRR